MGEIRVKVKITNAIDEALARRGEITVDEIRTRDAVAIVDLNVGCLCFRVRLPKN